MELHDAGNGNTVRSWASILDPNALEQAKRTARSPVIAGPLALMADAHLGMGATIGSVVPTNGAIIPSCVGVDLGCGMSAVKFNRTSDDLPDDLSGLLADISEGVPAGVGNGHKSVSTSAWQWVRKNPAPNHAGLSDKHLRKVTSQLGSLGAGNHFLEVAVDGDNAVWVVLHSGSRGIGNALASKHIRDSKELCRQLDRALEDRDLAYYLATDPGYDGYIADMLWSQEWAYANRDAMMTAATKALDAHVPGAQPLRGIDKVQCHHNYCARETHEGRSMWITRKGAIRARAGDRGIIPGSMGTSTHIVEGTGSALSYESASHGAGRTMSRTKARRDISPDDLAESMAGRTWLNDSAAALVDEAPSAYKAIEQVMADQADLVTVTHTLEAVLNYKGV